MTDDKHAKLLLVGDELDKYRDDIRIVLKTDTNLEPKSISMSFGYQAEIFPGFPDRSTYCCFLSIPVNSLDIGKYNGKTLGEVKMAIREYIYG